MRALHRFFILILTSVLFFECQKEVGYVGSGDPGGVVLPDALTANLQGNIIDESNQPASGVQIKVGSKTATTDAKGYFRINGASLDKNAALVTADKTGYFTSYRVFSATSGTNQVVIKLVKKSLSGTINGTAGGDVTLANGSKISLPANGIVLASNNSAYSGTVNVYAAYIDPTSPDIRETVPGSFMANDKDGKRVLLSSYGMMAVELESSTGEKLQVKSGAVATLTTPIPSAAQSSAPASIPLWYVDQSTGLWKEEGSATKQGTAYVGTVKHFTYWNCDLPLKTVNFTATFKNADGKPLVHVSIVVKPATGDYYGSAHGFTDSLGQVSGPVPINMDLVLQITDPCGSVIYSQNIPASSQNISLGTITIPSSTGSVVTIKGRLLTCSGTNVTNGFAIVSINNRAHYAAVDANGNFSTNYVLCNNNTNAQILGVDASTQQQGTASTVAVTAPTTNVGDVIACGTSAAQFINYNLDGTPYTIGATDSLTAFTDGQGTITPHTTYISGFHMTGGAVNSISFKFSHATNAAGVYPVVSINVQNVSNPTPIQPFNVTITNFPQALGEFYEGSVSGQFKDASNVTHNVTASFRIRRSR